MKEYIIKVVVVMTVLRNHQSNGLSCFVGSWKDEGEDVISQKECHDEEDVCFISRIVTIMKDGNSSEVFFGQCMRNSICPLMTCDRLISRAEDTTEITDCEMTCCQKDRCNSKQQFVISEEAFRGSTEEKGKETEDEEDHYCYTGPWTSDDVSRRKIESCSGSHCIISQTVATSPTAESLVISYMGLCVSERLCQLDHCELVRQSFENIERMKSCKTFCCSENLCNDPYEAFPELEEEELTALPCEMKRRSHDQCCGDDSYDSLKTGCCSGKTFRLSNSGCCNGVKYSLAIKTCEEGRNILKLT